MIWNTRVNWHLLSVTNFVDYAKRAWENMLTICKVYVYLLVHPPTGTYKVIKDFYVRRVICNSDARKKKKHLI